MVNQIDKGRLFHRKHLVSKIWSESEDHKAYKPQLQKGSQGRYTVWIGDQIFVYYEKELWHNRGNRIF